MNVVRNHAAMEAMSFSECGRMILSNSRTGTELWMVRRLFMECVNRRQTTAEITRDVVDEYLDLDIPIIDKEDSLVNVIAACYLNNASQRGEKHPNLSVVCEYMENHRDARAIRVQPECAMDMMDAAEHSFQKTADEVLISLGASRIKSATLVAEWDNGDSVIVKRIERNESE